jgi:hypothetical protein
VTVLGFVFGSFRTPYRPTQPTGIVPVTRVPAPEGL